MPDVFPVVVVALVLVGAALLAVRLFSGSRAQKVDLRETELTFAREAVVTGDDFVVGVDARVSFRVIDATRAAQAQPDHLQAMEQVARTTLREVVGRFQRDRVGQSSFEVSRLWRRELDASASAIGVRVSSAQVSAIEQLPGLTDK